LAFFGGWAEDRKDSHWARNPRRSRALPSSSRPFTPLLFPPLYAFMVWAEALISGTSTNPARSFGPSVISGEWQGWWIYWIGPMVGMFLALLVCSRLAQRIEVAKIYYFDSDRDRLFRRMARPKLVEEKNT